jgi:hypothetical protein
MTDEQIRQRAVSIAVEAAEADTIQTYTSQRPFVPHEWVVRAIAKALKERTPVQVGRAVTDVITEIVERATASVREASDRNAELISRALERIELLEAEPTGHGNNNRTIELLEDHRALSGRVQAMTVRIDQLEAGRTGRKWVIDGQQVDGPQFVAPPLEGHTMRRHAKPPEFVHPDNLQTVHEVAADGGDDMARGILQLTKERDEARRALKAQHDQYEHEIEQYKNAAAERERSRVATQREADTVRESLEMAARDRDRFNAGLTDANGRIAELQAQRLKERLTIVDQARQIAELRTTLEQRASEHAAALSRQASTWESDRREGAEQVRRLIEENQNLRSQSGTMWPKSERDKAMAKIAELQLERDNTWRLLDHRVDGQPFYSEQDRPIGDMVHEVLEHYRREIAIATAHLKERTAEADRMRPFVVASQRWCNAWLHDGHRAPIDRPMSSAMVAQTCALMEAYETACSQAADEDDDGFANAAANEGARIAAESRAETESDPGSVSG